MSHSPSISQQASDNKPEALSPDAIFLNSQRKLYCSTVSLELNRDQQYNLMSSRVNLFCEQQKLLAQKDLRIQELLMEIRSLKDETNYMISQLQQNVSQLLRNNHILETEITEMIEQKNIDKMLMLQKDKVIQELKSKVQYGAFNAAEKGEQKSIYDSLAEQEKMEDQMKDQGADADRNNGESGSKSNILSYFQQSSESLQEGITRGRLRALEEKEKLLYFFAESFCRQLDFNEQEKDLFLNEPLESIISTFLEELKGQRDQRKRLKDLNQLQSISILDLQKIIDQHIYERRQILDEKNKLKENLECFHTETSLSEELKNTKEKFNKLSEEKRILELELFRAKMDNEETKNKASLDFRSMVYSLGEEEKFNINSPSPIQERAQSEEQSSRNSTTRGLNMKIEQLQEVVECKNARLNQLQSRHKECFENLGKIYELSKAFDSQFCSFVDGSQTKKQQIFERIARNLKDRLRLKREPVETISNPNDEGNEDECYENLEPSCQVVDLI